MFLLQMFLTTTEQQQFTQMCSWNEKQESFLLQQATECVIANSVSLRYYFCQLKAKLFDVRNPNNTQEVSITFPKIEESYVQI
jgi:hypothetical protein